MFLDRSSGRRRVSVVVLAAALVAAAATGPAASAGVALRPEDPTGGPWGRGDRRRGRERLGTGRRRRGGGLCGRSPGPDRRASERLQ